MSQRTRFLFAVLVAACCNAALGATVARNFGPFGSGASVAGIVLGENRTHVVLADSTSGPTLLRIAADNKVVRAVHIGFFHATALAQSQPGLLLAGSGRGNVPWVMSLNDGFEVNWAETLDGDFVPQAIAAASDGSIYLGGYRAGGGQTAALIKMAVDGSIVWCRTVHGSGHADQITALQPTNDGVVAAGSTECGASLWKVRSDGKFDWQRCFTSGSIARFTAVAAAGDDDIVAVGHDDATMIVVKTNGAGLFRWKTAVTAAHLADATDVIRSKDQIIVSGAAEATPDHANLAVIAFSLDGKPLWQRIYGSSTETRAIAMSSSFSHRNAAPDGEGGVTVGAGIEDSVRVLRITHDASLSENCGLAEGGLSFFPSPPVGGSIAVETNSFEAAVHRVQGVTSTADASSTPVVCSPPSTTAVALETNPPKALKEDRRDVYKQTADLLVARKFAELDTLADEWRHTHARIEPLSPKLLILYDAVAGPAVGSQVGEDAQEKLLKEWIAARPASPTAVLALARYYATQAGTKRGSSFTVTDKGNEELQRYTAASLKLLKEHQRLAGVDPQYDAILITASVDGSRYFQLGPGAQADVDVIGAAATFLLPQWGGTPEQYDRLIDIAVMRTKDDLGETMYARLAWRLVELSCCDDKSELWDTYHLDWSRIRKGFLDWSAHDENSPVPIHRLAVFAYRHQNRALLAEILSRPDVKWDALATNEWQSQSMFEAARKWAFPKTSTLGSPAASTWPPVLLDVDVTLRNDERRRLSGFLAHGPDGVVAVSSIEPFRPKVTLVPTAQTLTQVAAWKITRPAQPEKPVVVSGYVTPLTSFDRGVVLSVAPLETPVVQALEISEALPEMGGTVFLVACRRSETTCEQRVYKGTVVGGQISSGAGSGPAGIDISVDGVLADDVIGAPVVDEGGFAACVVVGNGPQYNGKPSMACEGLPGRVKVH